MEVTKKTLYKLYIKERKTTTEIAKIFNICATTVQNRLREFSIPIRNNRDAQVKRITIKKKVLINLYYKQDMTLKEIGKMFKCNEESIRKLMISYNIERKDKTRNFFGWNKGLTKETNKTLKNISEKISKTRKELFLEGKLIHPNLGKTTSLPTKIKISKKLKGRFLDKENPNWKGGDNNKYRAWRRRISDSLEYRQLREDVYKRDKYKCQKCFKPSNGDIEMHHIKKVKSYPKLIMSIDNCITLCKKCHQSIKNKEELYEKDFYERIHN